MRTMKLRGDGAEVVRALSVRSDDEVMLIGQQVDNLPLRFVAPLQADHGCR